jgi:hypothetical protein
MCLLFCLHIHRFRCNYWIFSGGISTFQYTFPGFQLPSNWFSIFFDAQKYSPFVGISFADVFSSEKKITGFKHLALKTNCNPFPQGKYVFWLLKWQKRCHIIVTLIHRFRKHTKAWLNRYKPYQNSNNGYSIAVGCCNGTVNLANSYHSSLTFLLK